MAYYGGSYQHHNHHRRNYRGVVEEEMKMAGKSTAVYYQQLHGCSYAWTAIGDGVNPDNAMFIRKLKEVIEARGGKVMCFGVFGFILFIISISVLVQALIWGGLKGGFVWLFSLIPVLTIWIACVFCGMAGRQMRKAEEEVTEFFESYGVQFEPVRVKQCGRETLVGILFDPPNAQYIVPTEGGATAIMGEC